LEHFHERLINFPECSRVCAIQIIFIVAIITVFKVLQFQTSLKERQGKSAHHDEHHLEKFDCLGRKSDAENHADQKAE
jgi:hypothetical protein